MQVDLHTVKKQSKKTIAPSKNKEILTKSKRKRSAETQTRLTRKDKILKDTSGKWFVNKCITTIENNILDHGSNSKVTYTNQAKITTPSQTCTSYYVMQPLDPFSLNDSNLGNMLNNNMSNSGTQTSPRGKVDVGIIASSDFNHIAFSLFKNQNDNDNNDNISCNITKNVSHSSTQNLDMQTSTEDLDQYTTSQLFIEEADEINLIRVEENNNKCVDSSSTDYRRPPTLANQVRSSSIETQTDHDVLLSTNANQADDPDNIILTHTETQTETDPFITNLSSTSSSCQVSGSCLVHDSDSPWCSIETQTCEDFSDIEQFLCSTIHTQTHDKAQSELFPELTFTDTQTQTGCDDSPLLVTTHTQTPSLFH